MEWHSPTVLQDFCHELGLELPELLLEEALTHPSCRECNPELRSNEQLETLGDAVLDLLVCDALIRDNPERDSGELTQLRSALVSNRILAKLGEKMGIDQILSVTDGYTTNYRDIANAVEALFGAIFRQNHYAGAEKFFEAFYHDLKAISQKKTSGIFKYYNPIGELQEFTQRHKIDLPLYQLQQQKGPDHSPEFIINGSITLPDGQEISHNGVGNSKKEARENAAKAILSHLTDLF